MRHEFEPQEMVCWFHPIQLARTAFRVLFADYLTSVVDVREMQAGLERVTFPPDPRLQPPDPVASDPKTVFDVSWREHGKPVWIDYVADLGDGWDATYGVAQLIAQKELKIRGLATPLPRADLLVLGGDCVYPTPSLKEYRNRLEGPYDAALSDVNSAAAREAAQSAGEHPKGDPNLLAIPGNHDWYDGLMSFSRLFCRGSWIGAWRTRQTRSYFAAKLPGPWMLWGIDIQLDSRIDAPQLNFFANAAAEFKTKCEAKPRVIICTARPAWLRDRPAYKHAFRNYWFFVAQALSHGCDPWVTLSGDLHHYARLESSHGRQLVTAGGGGSYISATHDLPKIVRSPGKDEEMVQTKAEYHAWADGDGSAFVDSGFSYPSRADSRRISLRSLGFPFWSANWTFCLFVGLGYAWFAWMLRWSAGPDIVSRQVGFLLRRLASFPLTGGGLRGLWELVWDTLTRYPSTWLPPLVLVGSAAYFCALSEPGRPRWTRWWWGGLHGLAQVGGGVTTAWLLARAFDAVSDNFAAARWEMVLWFLSLITVGGLLGGFLMGAYLVVSDRLLRWHVNEVFSAQASPDYRCFIRMCVQTDGTLTLYPIALRRVPRRWRPRVGARDWEPRFEARDEGPGPELIEGPITIARPA